MACEHRIVAGIFLLLIVLPVPLCKVIKKSLMQTEANYKKKQVNFKHVSLGLDLHPNQTTRYKKKAFVRW